MTPKQVLALLTREQIEDILTECCYFLEPGRIAIALHRGLDVGETQHVMQHLWNLQADLSEDD